MLHAFQSTIGTILTIMGVMYVAAGVLVSLWRRESKDLLAAGYYGIFMLFYGVGFLLFLLLAVVFVYI